MWKNNIYQFRTNYDIRLVVAKFSHAVKMKRRDANIYICFKINLTKIEKITIVINFKPIKKPC